MRESAGITIEDDSVCLNYFAVGQPHNASVIRSGHAVDVFAIAKFSALYLPLFCNYLRQPVHAALNHPHAVLLDVCDEHQRRGRKIWRGAAISRIAAEQLAQARVFEIAIKLVPQRLKRAHRKQIREATQACTLQHAHE